MASQTIRLLVVTSAYPQAGTPEKGFIFEEIKAFAEAGMAVTLMPVRSIDSIDLDLPEGVNVDMSYARGFFFPTIIISLLLLPLTKEVWNELLAKPSQFFRWRFWKEAARLSVGRRIFSRYRMSFDVAYTFWFTADTAALVHVMSSPVITRTHGYDLYEELPVNGGRIPFRAASLERIAKIVTLSSEALHYLQARYELAANGAARVSLGVPTQSLPEIFEEASLKFLSCAFPSTNKRLGRIGETVAAFARRFPAREVVWYHIGCDAELLEFSGPLPCNMRIEALGKLSRDDVLTFYRRNEIFFFLNLSLSEGQPVSIMEAMSFGVPVVATAVGGIPEMLESGGGLMVSVESTPDEIAHRLAEVYCDPTWSRQLRDEARIIQQRSFSAPANAQLMVSLIREMSGNE